MLNPIRIGQCRIEGRSGCATQSCIDSNALWHVYCLWREGIAGIDIALASAIGSGHSSAPHRPAKLSPQSRSENSITSLDYPMTWAVTRAVLHCLSLIHIVFQYVMLQTEADPLSASRKTLN
jgi:hypothetical protein